MTEESNEGKFDFEIEEKGQDISDKYRTVFLSGDGILVLNDILAMCHYGEDLDAQNPVEVAEYNIGLRILRKCTQGEKQLYRVLSRLAIT